MYDSNNCKYREYLLSEDWRRVAQQRIEIDGGKCVMCGCEGTNFNRLCVHHLTYRHIFDENPYTDLVTLCESCHKAVHRMMNRINDKSGRRGWKDTLTFSTINQ